MNHPTSTRPSAPRSSAFTLVELLGVLAVLTILFTVAIEGVLERMKQANRTAETTDLGLQIKALERSILRTQTVPSAATWIGAVANELAWSSNTVALNRQGNWRILVVDSTCRLGPSAGSTVPYAQSSVGSLPPVSPRFVLLSSVAAPLPSLGGITFDALWNSSPTVLPAGWPSSWGGKANDLRIERLDLRQRFHRVVLNNVDQYNTALFSLGTGTNVGIASFQTREAWYLAGSLLNLRFPDGSLQAAEFVNDDTSFAFEQGRWGRGVVTGRGSLDGSFGSLVDAYLSAPPPPEDPNQFGSNQQSIVNAFHLYIWTYGLWASDGFPDGGSSSAQQVPWYRVVQDAQTHLADFTSNLLK